MPPARNRRREIGGYNPIADRFQNPTITPVNGSRSLPGTSTSTITVGDRRVADAVDRNTAVLSRLHTALRGPTNRNERLVYARR